MIVKETTDYVLYDEGNGMVELFATNGYLMRRLNTLAKRYMSIELKPVTYALTEEVIGLSAKMPEPLLKVVFKPANKGSRQY